MIFTNKDFKNIQPLKIQMTTLKANAFTNF